MALAGLDAGLPQPLVRRFVRPSEAYGFWDYHFGGFAMPCRDLVADDVTRRVRQRLQVSLHKIRTAQRDVLLLKITGWPRLGFLAAVLPEAKFLHIYRDGRDVAYSMLGRRWWPGWQAPTSWVVEGFSDRQRKRWEESGRSFITLAGLQWEMLLDSFERARGQLNSDRVLSIRYEDLCAKPDYTIRKILQFANLPAARDLDRALVRHPFINANGKWRAGLTATQSRELEQSIEETLHRYGYGPRGGDVEPV